MGGPSIDLALERPALPLDAAPGGEIVLRGSFHSTLDGSTVDAAITTWPSGAPGGASVDSGGLIDFEGGGLSLVSRDPVTHEVHAIATGEEGPACQLAQVASPCLPLRTLHQARTRLTTMREWSDSLKGGIRVEVVAPPVYAPALGWAAHAAPAAATVTALLLIGAGGWLGYRWYRRWSRAPARRLARLAERVQRRAASTDPVLAAPLTRALTTALVAVRERRLDPGSTQGLRVAEVLTEVEETLLARQAAARANDEKAAADELVLDIQIALEAAEEASRAAGKPRH